jgi:hypothetical protein
LEQSSRTIASPRAAEDGYFVAQPIMLEGGARVQRKNGERGGTELPSVHRFGSGGCDACHGEGDKWSPSPSFAITARGRTTDLPVKPR